MRMVMPLAVVIRDELRQRQLRTQLRPGEAPYELSTVEAFPRLAARNIDIETHTHIKPPTLTPTLALTTQSHT